MSGQSLKKHVNYSPTEFMSIHSYNQHTNVLRINATSSPRGNTCSAKCQSNKEVYVVTWPITSKRMTRSTTTSSSSWFILSILRMLSRISLFRLGYQADMDLKFLATTHMASFSWSRLLFYWYHLDQEPLSILIDTSSRLINDISLVEAKLTSTCRIDLREHRRFRR